MITFVAIEFCFGYYPFPPSLPCRLYEASDIVDGFFVKFILWGILTTLAYHIAGGIRHLHLMDLGHFEELESGAKSALRRLHSAATAVLSLLAGILVW
ncbi:succinate dehydrogenase cytochrome b556 large subunit [Vibrio lentus]|nr:succinate dehydrogenase cytochrome b556 large subunit [Vibrio lentus]